MFRCYDLTSHRRQVDQVQLNMPSQSDDIPTTVSSTSTTGLDTECRSELDEVSEEPNGTEGHSSKI